MVASGITLSTVLISKGAEQELLKEMATIAGGRHDHCDDPADVPRILVQETKVAAADEGYRDSARSLCGRCRASRLVRPLRCWATPGPIPSPTPSRCCSPWPATRC